LCNKPRLNVVLNVDKCSSIFYDFEVLKKKEFFNRFKCFKNRTILLSIKKSWVVNSRLKDVLITYFDNRKIVPNVQIINSSKSWEKLENSRFLHNDNILFRIFFIVQHFLPKKEINKIFRLPYLLNLTQYDL